jgi:hypothetical protein
MMPKGMLANENGEFLGIWNQEAMMKQVTRDNDEERERERGIKIAQLAGVNLTVERSRLRTRAPSSAELGRPRDTPPPTAKGESGKQSGDNRGCAAAKYRG